METSVLEQMRLQEGHLFQNESALALYLDAKAIVLEAIISCLRHSSPTVEELAEFSDATSEKYSKSLQALSPEGIQDYHAKSLHDCCKTVAKLLWPTQLLLTARPKIQTLLKGLCTRLVANDSVKSASFLALDPMLQDFVVREAFRRTIVNDCLVVFEADAADADDRVDRNDMVDRADRSDAGALDADAVDAYTAAQQASRARQDGRQDGRRHFDDDSFSRGGGNYDDVLPSDSASQVGHHGGNSSGHSDFGVGGQRPFGAHSTIRPRPTGASSAIGGHDDDNASVVESVLPPGSKVASRAPSVVGPLGRAPSVVGPIGPLGPSGPSGHSGTSVAPSVSRPKSVIGSVAASVAPRVTTAYGDKTVVSRSSASTGITNTNFRKPFNVRTVQLDIPEEH
jgi:hypothetical protein